MSNYFIATKIETQTAQVIHDYQNKLAALDGFKRVNWTDPRDLHITLLFFGNIDTETANDYLAIFASNEINISSFQLSINKIDGFPTKQKARVLWLGDENVYINLKKLHLFYQNLYSHLLGPKKHPSYIPHITIGRPKSKNTIGLDKEGLPESPSLEFKISEIGFYKSHPGKQAPKYEILALKFLLD